MNRMTIWGAAALMVVATAVGCGGQTDAPADHAQHNETAVSSPGTAVPAGPTIAIEGMGFSSLGPVAPGTEITIVNNDEVEHSVTSRTKDLFDVHVDGKEQATLKAPDEPGEYAFYCLYHPAMLGTLTVR
ncbi:cupredoxin domain-containing protein [Mycolicibacterium sp. HK-90]|uniref:cupredoxin domain-containing protein n=1 Tax=Mycolicibacterium sp. HK-90 TaxID=3056937 RepID=UPI00265A2540|nr:cupredoxin domain-containing protein [Mycolicibacterium sp. HK-90]WKG00939.1 cupredoxin domain-containing protein [Mycolicibacterium sp. HK-90]